MDFIASPESITSLITITACHNKSVLPLYYLLLPFVDFSIQTERINFAVLSPFVSHGQLDRSSVQLDVSMCLPRLMPLQVGRLQQTLQAVQLNTSFSLRNLT